RATAPELGRRLVEERDASLAVGGVDGHGEQVEHLGTHLRGRQPVLLEGGHADAPHRCCPASAIGRGPHRPRDRPSSLEGKSGYGLRPWVYALPPGNRTRPVQDMTP